MLRELEVQNLALIEDVRVELNEGFCAWTGETGASRHNAGRGEGRHDTSRSGRIAQGREEEIVTPMTRFEIKTRARNQFVEITDQVRAAVTAAGVRSGLCVVYCPHTTAAITVNENADPDVVHDMLLYLNQSVPKDQPGFRHGEGNSDSHIKASLVGPSVTLVVDGGDVVLGRWQGVYFCEFDGPRTREVVVQTVATDGQ